MSFHRASILADSVMMEGYALYPYRASAPKNRYRWTFGVLAPRAWSEAGGGESWWLAAQLLVHGEPSRIGARLRFFQIERRTGPDGVWDEGRLHSFDFVVAARGELPLMVAASRAGDEMTTTTCAPLCCRVVTDRELVDAERGIERITIRVENTTPWSTLDAPRTDAIASSLASTHLLIEVDDGALLSTIDPPEWALAAAAMTTNTRTYPALVGAPGAADLMLCAPFVLPDHAQVAPESTGDLCDATEIDELLLLRTRTLTDDEKRQARATSPHTAAIVDRAEAMPADDFARLHGATRDVCAGEMVPHATRFAVGSKVRLRAPTRRSDAQDLLYAGHVATIAEVKHDVDGTVFYAVTIDDDPATELHLWHGVHHHYRDDEVDPL